MKKIFIMTILVMLYSTICFANIDSSNECTVSHTDEKLDDFLYGITFKKYDNQYYIQSKLLHSLNKQGYVITLEDCKIKSENQTVYLHVRTSEVFCGFRQRLAIKLNQDSVNLIANANQLTITLPYYKDGSDYDVRYKIITIPAEVMNEWKEVIKSQ